VGQSGLTNYDSIQWRTYKSGTTGPAPFARELVLQTPGSWQAFYREATGNPAAFAPADVDWGKELLVAICLGQRPTTGYSVFVESVKRIRPNEILVGYVESTPRRGEAVAEMLTSPWIVIRMNRAAGQILFSKRKVEGRPGLIQGTPNRCGCGCSRCTCGGNFIVIQSGPILYPGSPGIPGDALQNIQWRTYREGTQSRIERFETLVIETPGDWQRYWARSTGSPPASAPTDIDWNREKLAVVHLGQQKSGGYRVYVETIDRPRAAEICVRYVTIRPAPGTPTIQVLTSPFVIVRMNRIAGNVVFRGRELREAPIGSPCRCGCRSCH
jgi:hypothetical protein